MLFKRKTVERVVESLSDLIVELEEISRDKVDEVSDLTQQIAEIEAERAAATAERERADRISSKLRGLLS